MSGKQMQRQKSCFPGSEMSVGVAMESRGNYQSLDEGLSFKGKASRLPFCNLLFC